jgi:hypothetical protein
VHRFELSQPKIAKSLQMPLNHASGRNGFAKRWLIASSRASDLAAGSNTYGCALPHAWAEMRRPLQGFGAIYSARGPQ